MAQRFDYRVVKHPTTIEKTSGDKERGGKSEPLQNRKADSVVVGIPIVKRDRRGARRETAESETLNCFRQWEHVKPCLHPMHLRFETNGVRLVRKERIRLRQHAMEDEHGEP